MTIEAFPAFKQKCSVCQGYGIYTCARCNRHVCMRHYKRRKIDGKWSWQCTECTEKIDQDRRAGR